MVEGELVAVGVSVDDGDVPSDHVADAVNEPLSEADTDIDGVGNRDEERDDVGVAEMEGM